MTDDASLFEKLGRLMDACVSDLSLDLSTEDLNWIDGVLTGL